MRRRRGRVGRGGRIVIDRVSESKPGYGDLSHEVYRGTLPVSAVRARPSRKAESSIPGIVLPGAGDIAAPALPVLPGHVRHACLACYACLAVHACLAVCIGCGDCAGCGSRAVLAAVQQNEPGVRDEREEDVPGGDAGPEPCELLQLRERVVFQLVERDDGPCGAREADDPFAE